MTKRNWLHLSLMIFPILLLLAATIVLPKEIYISYTDHSFANESSGLSMPSGLPEGIGSKYTLLTYAIMPLLFGICDLLSLRSTKKRARQYFDESVASRNDIPELGISMAILLYLNLDIIYRVTLAYCNPVGGALGLSYNSNIDGIFLGITALIIGNFIPKYGFGGVTTAPLLPNQDEQRLYRKTKLILSFCTILTGLVLILFNWLILEPNNGTYFTSLILMAGCGIPALIIRKVRQGEE